MSHDLLSMTMPFCEDATCVLRTISADLKADRLQAKCSIFSNIRQSCEQMFFKYRIRITCLIISSINSSCSSVVSIYIVSKKVYYVAFLVCTSFAANCATSWAKCDFNNVSAHKGPFSPPIAPPPPPILTGASSSASSIPWKVRR